MSEVDAAGGFDGFGSGDIFAGNAVEESAFGDEVPPERGVDDGPGFAAVFGAGEEMAFGLFAVYCVAFRAEIFVGAFGESDEDFVVPDPHAVVGGPPAETGGLVEDFDVGDVGGVEVCEGDVRQHE